MKKYLVAMVMLCAVLSACAQFGDHKFLAGAAVSGNYYRSSSNNSTSNSVGFGLSPHLGLVLGANSVLGLDVSGSLWSTKADDNGVSNTLSLGAGPFYERYYSMGERFFFTTKLGTALSTSKNTFSIDGDEQHSGRQRTFSVNLNPGLAWMASERVLLNAFIGVIGYSTNTNYSSLFPGSESTSLQIGFQSPSFRVSFLLN